MKENLIEKKSFDFSVRIVNLYKYLRDVCSEWELSRQILRSGTSIGANVAEAIHAQSKADFFSKMKIAAKEANETRYWLMLLHSTGYIDEREFKSMSNDLSEVIKLLVAICKSTDPCRKQEESKGTEK